MKKLLSIFLVLLLLAGCAPTTTTDTTDPDAEATETADMMEEKVVTVATISDLQSLDQFYTTDGTSFIAIASAISGLTQIAEDGSVLPDIAKSWEVSEDGATYTFNLRDDYKWSNGDPVTANDFVYSWNRMVQPLDGASAEYSFIFGAVKMVGADGSGELGAKAIDDYTLEVQLEQPIDFFLSLLAFPAFFPLNETFVEEKGNQYATSVDNFLSNGPYILDSWTPGTEFSYIKNPDYPMSDEVNIDRLTFKLLKDTQSAMMAFDADQVDVVPVSGQLVDIYKTRDEFNQRLSGYVWYLALNEEKDLGNKNLRLALAHAIDKDTIAESVLKDGSIGANGIIPKDLAGKDGVDFREASGTYQAFDLALAQEYLAKAKEELGTDQITLSMVFEDSDSSKSVAEFLQSQIETNLEGVTVEMNQQSKKARLTTQQEGNFDIGLTRWGPDYADPQTYLELFLSDAGDYLNSSRYASESYDSLGYEAFNGEASKDSDLRWTMMLEMEKTLLEDGGIIPLYQNGAAVMIKNGVSGIEFHPVAIDSYKHLSVE